MARRKKKKKGRGRPSARSRAATAAQGSLDEELDLASRMLRDGDAEGACARARRLHKREPCTQSAELLTRANIARIERAIPHKKAAAVQGMIKAAAQRVPEHAAEIERRLDYLSAWHGDASGLLGPWAAGDPPPAQRAHLDREIRRWIRDPGLVASCPLLDDGHELRVAAAALEDAFAAVTSGPLDNEQIALREVSRRSPLAAWKYLVRAVAHLYRGEDDEALRAAALLPQDSAPARLVPALEAMTSPAAPRGLDACSRTLVQRVSPDLRKLRGHLRTLEQRLEHGSGLSEQGKAIRAAVKECERAAPGLLDALRQRISIRCYLEELPTPEVRRALGGASRRDAGFWRLLARAAEYEADEMFSAYHLFQACAAWEEFRRHAIAEGWIAGGGVEEATVYLHMAMLLRKPRWELDPTQFLRRFDNHRAYYQDQPAEIRALSPTTPPDTYFVHIDRIFARAADCHPSAEVFGEWLGWVRETSDHWRPADEVALRWHEAAPDNPRPLLLLADSAERRNALKKALGYLDRAEALDALDSQVVRARLRLLVSTARRHIKGGKLHLAERDIAQLTALRGANVARRQAFVEALSFATTFRSGDDEAQKDHRERTVGLIDGELEAHALLHGVSEVCGQTGPELDAALPAMPALVRHGALAAAAVRAIEAGDEMACPLPLPRAWLGPLRKDVESGPCGLDPTALGRLASAALRQHDDHLAYHASGAGLQAAGERDAHLLFLRGQALPGFAIERRVRIMRAALTLARRARDADLASQVVDLHRRWTGQDRGARVWGIPTEFAPLEDDDLAQALRHERETTAFPTPATYDRYEYEDPDDVCDCPACRRRRGELDDGDWDDDEPLLEDLLGQGVGELHDGIPEEVMPEVLDDLGQAFAGPNGERMSQEATALLLEMIQKFAGPDGELPSPEEVASRDPDLFRRLMEVAGPQDDDFLPPAPGGRRSKKKKKRKRR